MFDREKTDDEIRESIRDHFYYSFINFDGDYLDGTVDGTEDDYERALDLMSNAKVVIDWNGGRE